MWINLGTTESGAVRGALPEVLPVLWRKVTSGILIQQTAVGKISSTVQNPIMNVCDSEPASWSSYEVISLNVFYLRGIVLACLDLCVFVLDLRA